MKKELLSPGNRVLGEDREITIIELSGRGITDNVGEFWPYDKIDGILITPDLLSEEGFLPRTLTTTEGKKTDFVKLITITETEFFTVSVQFIEPGKWKLEILDKNHKQICLDSVTYWHTLQNITSAHVFG